MNLLLRLFLVLLRAWLRPRRAPSDPSRLRFRVWPHDLGWRNHLPNYRYFSFFELGRFDLWHASRLPFSGRYRMRLIAAQELVYIRQIRPFSAFDCHTRLVGWDEKYCYYLHEVRCGTTLVAAGLVKEALLLNGRVVPPQSVLQLPMQKAPVMVQWQALQQQLKRLTDET